MSQTDFVIMKMGYRCGFCGKSVAANDDDIFHETPVCDGFKAAIEALGGKDYGPRLAIGDGNTLSVDTRPADQIAAEADN